MKFFIKSFGCQMNIYDSKRIEDSLLAAGYEKADNWENAKIVIFNTCSIREKADEKLFSDLGRVRLLKEESFGDFVIVVAGCVAQSQHKDIVKRAPYVDIILGSQDIYQIVDKIDSILKKKTSETIIATIGEAKSKFRNLEKQFFNRSVSEFVTIQEGCNNFCTYCVVPYTRGREFSRNAFEIIEETKKLLSFGVKEIILLGQNVNSYTGDGLDGKKWNLSRLLFELAKLSDLRRLRYITSHPKNIDIEIAKAHRDIDILAPFLHLPIQSGSDSILTKMNRKYSASEYVKCIELLREYGPNIAFSTDFIVGFPGETDEDFKQTIKLAERIKFAQAYSFKYSSRPNTAAAKMNDQISEKIKSERLKILRDLLDDQQTRFNQSCLGKSLNVLFTKKGRHKNQFVGRSEYSQAVSLCANNVNIGDIVPVKIMQIASHSLIGVIEA
jgi:tRNA-2-methylthio-N6-dimethylallyladenosine synthase